MQKITKSLPKLSYDDSCPALGCIELYTALVVLLSSYNHRYTHIFITVREVLLEPVQSLELQDEVW